MVYLVATRVRTLWRVFALLLHTMIVNRYLMYLLHLKDLIITKMLIIG